MVTSKTRPGVYDRMKDSHWSPSETPQKQNTEKSGQAGKKDKAELAELEDPGERAVSKKIELNKDIRNIGMGDDAEISEEARRMLELEQENKS